MPEIRQLSPHVADMIAAGEVVERPASVVKELLENSADAGADIVSLEIRSGGMSYIRVTDNGCGMSPKDARTAFLRHATSKLRDERGLEAIGTLGFRGEALAAISAVSRIELLTREADSDEGTRLIIEAGNVVEVSPAGCPIGTTIIVRDLFYNTPARLKFMKSDRAEAGAVSAAAMHFALSRPELSLRYIRDGQEEFHTPGDGSAASSVYTILGRDTAQTMLKVDGEANGVKVTGFACTPYSARGNRTMQLFFVNGRFVKSKTLQAALEQAYKNQLFTGKYPSCVLYIRLNLANVDVNVHPAKTEVRFLREKEVFDAVYYSVLGALSGDGSDTADISIGDGTRSVIGKPIVSAPVSKPAQIKSSVAARTPAPAAKPSLGGRVNASSGGFVTVKAGETNLFKAGGFKHGPGFRGIKKTEADPVRQTAIAMPEIQHQEAFVPMPTPQAADFSIPIPDIETVQEEIPVPGDDWRIVGEALNTYIIVEKGDSLILIDKHAAHERVIFDRLAAHKEQVMAQPLLAPIIMRLPAEDMALILDNARLMSEYGFEVDELAGELAVRTLPYDVDAGDAESMIEMIVSEIRTGSASPDSARDAVLHTVACKAAIKAGRRSDPRELEAVAKRVMSGEVRYCPHGRPVSVTLTKYELDKQFKRV